MDTKTALLSTDLPLEGRRQGKVRDIYSGKTKDGQDALIIIASDRVSAFDVVMENGIPGKGIVLTQISQFWFNKVAEELAGEMSHHLISTDANDIAGISEEEANQLQGRVMIGKKAEVVPIECIVRGYITGSGWKEYVKQGTVCSLKLPEGLKQCEKLSEPLFTPSTKAEDGHDENISFEQACELVGEDLMKNLRDLSLKIYQMGHDYARSRGIILADTKFEFGIPVGAGPDSTPILIDEVLTPDSSRFWPADVYESGHDQPSFDKQFVRNYLQEEVDQGRWDKTAPGPKLPDNIVDESLAKYLEAYRLLTGESLAGF